MNTNLRIAVLHEVKEQVVEAFDEPSRLAAACFIPKSHSCGNLHSLWGGTPGSKAGNDAGPNFNLSWCQDRSKSPVSDSGLDMVSCFLPGADFH